MSDLRVEAAALIEKTPADQLPLLGARILHAWCQANGTSEDSVARFVNQMIQVEGHEAISDVLTAMLSRMGPFTEAERPH
jgi:hypothetical protein